MEPFKAKTIKKTQLVTRQGNIPVDKNTILTVRDEIDGLGDVDVDIDGETKSGTMPKADYEPLPGGQAVPAPGAAPVAAQHVVAPVPQPAPVPNDSSPGNLAWGAKVSGLFRDKVRTIAADLGCDPNFLMAAMAFETGGTFSPSVKNKAGSGATGLIQFMPDTAIGIGTTTANLATMSAEEQLDFVAKYFDRQKGKLHTLEDVYMAILLPAAVGKPEDFVLFTKGTRAYDQNAGLDLNKNGRVTKAEAANLVQKSLNDGMKPGNVG